MPECTNRGGEKSPNEYYATTPYQGVVSCETLDQRVLRRAPKVILNPRNIAEPTAGAATWRLGFQSVWPHAKVKYIELDPELAQYSRNLGLDVDQADIMSYEFREKPDLIVGNPPFSLADTIIPRMVDSLAEGGVLAFLLRLNFFEGRERYQNFWQHYPASFVFPCPARPGFTADGGTDGTGYMLCTWVKGYEGPTILEHMDNTKGPVRWAGQTKTEKRAAVLDPLFPDPRTVPQPQMRQVAPTLGAPALTLGVES